MSVLSDLVTVKADFQRNVLIVLDQTRLPREEVFVELETAEEIRKAIYLLKVRGAPAIGIAAAYGLALCARKIQASEWLVFYRELIRIRDCLASSRPTAVNLFKALEHMVQCAVRNKEKSIPEIKHRLVKEAEDWRRDDATACRKMGEWGLTLLKPGMGLLTHCNAGHLAVSEYGTALAPIYLGQEKGYRFTVFADETRPLLQGARLTAYELQKAGIEVTLICDNMASAVMKSGKIQAVLVGCDRVAANGDVANKIGTSAVAILAHYYHIPFYVLGPSSTIDTQCPDGDHIFIEERKPEEVTEKWYEARMAPEEIKVFNPAFDVTAHELITAIITEKGIFYPPYHF